MLFLMLILGCEPTDPLESCIRTANVMCDCGSPEENCSSAAIQETCEKDIEFIDAERENCLAQEMRGCSGDFDKDYNAAKKACSMTTAD